VAVDSALHGAYVDRLGLDPSRFLLLLHSDSRNLRGLSNMAAWLRREYGVIYSEPVIEPYSSKGHMLVKIDLLNRHVTDDDWVLQVDADELLVFPQGQPASEALRGLEASGYNVMYSIMVDRVAEDGSIDIVPDIASSIFDQYPLNCAVTLLMQNSDIRKANVYRGYLRTTSGNHNVLGLNHSAMELYEDWINRHVRGGWSSRNAARLMTRLRRSIHEYLGDIAFAMMPRVYSRDEGRLPHLKPSPEYASAYHFKWIKGLAGKLKRRRETEHYTIGMYADLLQVLDQGNRFVGRDLEKLCNHRELVNIGSTLRGLTSEELILLFMNARPEHVDNYMQQAGIGPAGREAYVSGLLRATVDIGLARDNFLPTH